MATLVIACPTCLQKIRAPVAVLGRQIKCPQCKNGFTAADPGAVPKEPLVPAPTRPRDDDSPPAAVDPLGLDADEAELAEPVAAENPLVDYLMLRRSVTPRILVGLFWFVVAVELLIGVVWGIVTLAALVTRGTPVLNGILMLLLDGVVILGAIVAWRILCEALMALFRTAEGVRELNEQMRGK